MHFNAMRKNTMTSRNKIEQTGSSKRQQYEWYRHHDMKVSDVDETNSSSNARGLSEEKSMTIAQIRPPSKQSEYQYPLHQVKTPWTMYYKGIKTRHVKPATKSKVHSSNLIDMEKRLSTLVLSHSDDEILKRHFIDEDGYRDSHNGKMDDDNKRNFMMVSTVDGDATSKVTGTSVVAEGGGSTLPKRYHRKNRLRSPIKSLEAVRLPTTKSSKRHRFCLSNFPHTKRRQKAAKSQKIDEFQNEVTIDQKGLKQSWEYHVLSKLSGETQGFISHRFDGKEKPKEKLIDFLDAGYRDRDRSDYMTRKKKRLFDLPYKHEDFPNVSTHL